MTRKTQFRLCYFVVAFIVVLPSQGWWQQRQTVEAIPYRKLVGRNRQRLSRVNENAHWTAQNGSMRNMFMVAALAATLFTAAAHAQQVRPANPTEGKRLATELCAGCHVVMEGQQEPVIDVVPAFATIAADPQTTEFRLRVFLLDTPHPVMPNFLFTDEEVENLIAYILSLRTR